MLQVGYQCIVLKLIEYFATAIHHLHFHVKIFTVKPSLIVYKYAAKHKIVFLIVTLEKHLTRMCLSISMHLKLTVWNKSL